MRRHLYYYTHLDVRPEDARHMLRGDPGRWLPRPATPAGQGWLVDLQAGGALPRGIGHHPVVLEVGAPTEDSERLLRSVTWGSPTASGLFPVFDGDLELCQLAGDMCQLSLMGTYRPPLAVAGTAADALLGHRVAEACVRRLVLDLATKMTGVTLPG
jgi:hypothetical protein